MDRFPRILFGVVLAGIAIWLLTRLQDMRAADTSDGTQIMVYFLGFLATAIAAGILLALTLLPAIGDLLGSSVYGSNEQIEADPHREATACMARGEYEEADRAFCRIIEREPDDSLAVTELVRLRLEKLNDPDGAARALEQALEQEWPADEAGGFAIKLGDVYAEQQDNERAQAMWQQVVDSMPNTRHAANANSRLKKLE